MKRIPFYPLMILGLVVFGGYLGCDPSNVPVFSDVNSASSAPPPVNADSAIPQRTEDTILIGTFNIERLGQKKVGLKSETGQPPNTDIVQKLALIIRMFDVVAIQETVDREQKTIPELLRYVNQGGNEYRYTISPPIGRTSYTEQYVFIYDARRIRSGSEFSYVVDDQQDMLHREPFVGRFETKSPTKPFRFSLINMHTDPKEVDTELNVMANVYRNVRQFEYPEDDVMLLGDLNAAPNKFQDLGRIPSLVPLVTNQPTNTAKKKILDNILIDRQTTNEFTGRYGVVDLEKLFGISREEADKISDHLPVWAEFTAREAPLSTAATAGTQPTTVR